MQPYNAPLGAGLNDAESARSVGPPSRKHLREMRLRADKLVEVQSPTLVRCLNCGAAIKLSLKSDYDASHWLRHRTRCLKKTKAREEERGLQPTSSASSSITGSSPASSARALTPHDDDDQARDSIPDPLASLPNDLPIFHDWQGWDWSQLKSRFITSKQLL